MDYILAATYLIEHSPHLKTDADYEGRALDLYFAELGIYQHQYRPKIFTTAVLPSPASGHRKVEIYKEDV